MFALLAQIGRLSDNQDLSPVFQAITGWAINRMSINQLNSCVCQLNRRRIPYVPAARPVR